MHAFTDDPYYENVLAAKSVVGSKCEVHLRVMIFNLRLAITSEPHGLYYEDEYCYHDATLAFLAFTLWDGTSEPIGWAKHPRTGRHGPGFLSDEKRMRR